MPCIILLHGFQGFKDWGFFPYISEKITEARAITFCINFSLNGMGTRTDIAEYPEKFARMTVSQEIEDAELVIKNIIEGEFLDKDIWNGEIYLLGTSLGGGISILTAKRNKSINKIALWASIAKFDRYSLRQKNEWKEKGLIEFTNSVTKQLMKLNYTYIEDIEKNKSEYSLTDAISELKIPVLILHGAKDVSVQLKEAELLVESAPYGMTEFKVIEKTGHTFGIAHPFNKSTNALEQALEKTINFFGLK
ncbi:MAG: alpha/beta hydrolase [Ignavibacteriae bacterium]|nr:alpha/beta hydrolase [Ignavibacteriota bacterium]